MLRWTSEMLPYVRPSGSLSTLTCTVYEGLYGSIVSESGRTVIAFALSNTFRSRPSPGVVQRFLPRISRLHFALLKIGTLTWRAKWSSIPPPFHFFPSVTEDYLSLYELPFENDILLELDLSRSRSYHCSLNQTGHYTHFCIIDTDADVCNVCVPGL